MVTCPSCGEENPARFRLCGFCGTPLAPVAPSQEVRKTVTIVFSDLKGSTTMGEALDSESLREVMNRYFAEMRRVLEDHGGRVEKYIGDAVMAVFGLPRLHEDDALRAVRAAHGMKRALETLNAAFDEAVALRECRLVSPLADAGVGKSRLVEAFTTSLAGDARVGRGRCLPYGKGITFWPLVELVRDAAGIGEDDPPDAARAKLAGAVPGGEGG